MSDIRFKATIPPVETAIKIHGDSGARILLDIAESDLAAMLTILLMRGKVLNVHITDGGDETKAEVTNEG